MDASQEYANEESVDNCYMNAAIGEQVKFGIVFPSHVRTM